MSEQPSGIVRINREVTDLEFDQIRAAWETRGRWQVIVQDLPDPGRHEREPRHVRRRRRAEERKRKLAREIAVLECELGIACDEEPCTHWLKTERI